MKNLKEERIGEYNRNTDGELMQIVEYIDNKNVTVVFVRTGLTKKTRYASFKTGYVSTPELPFDPDETPHDGRGCLYVMLYILAACALLGYAIFHFFG